VIRFSAENLPFFDNNAVAIIESSINKWADLQVISLPERGQLGSGFYSPLLR
jgi:hypothetical protein